MLFGGFLGCCVLGLLVFCFWGLVGCLFFVFWVFLVGGGGLPVCVGWGAVCSLCLLAVAGCP